MCVGKAWRYYVCALLSGGTASADGGDSPSRTEPFIYGEDPPDKKGLAACYESKSVHLKNVTSVAPYDAPSARCHKFKAGHEARPTSPVNNSRQCRQQNGNLAARATGSCAQYEFNSGRRAHERLVAMGPPRATAREAPVDGWQREVLAVCGH